VTQNIVFRNYRGGIMVGAGSENIVENNIFVEATTSQVEFYDSRPEGKGNKFQRNIVCYASADGSALHLLQWRKDFVVSDYNLFFRVGGKLEVLTSGAQRRPWEDWLALGMDAHSLVADPLFADPTKDDYRLKPDSPAFKLGFQPIPVEKIGLRGYEGAWKITR
jgi:parallel beta-helix repeat protein